MKRERKFVAFLQLGIVFLSFFLSLTLMLEHPSFTGAAIYQNQPDPTEGKDTYIHSGVTSFNFGAHTRFTVGKNAGGAQFRPLLEFNVSSINSEDSIVSAVAGVYVETLNTPTMAIEVYRITSSWDEGTGTGGVTGDGATWTNRTGSALWSTAGGDYSGVLLDSVEITSASQWYNFSITDAVQGWVNGSFENYGIILVPASSVGNNNLTTIFSSDYTDDTGLRPFIYIEHTTNAAPTIENFSNNGSLENIKQVGENVVFTIDWNDLEGDNSRIFVCNSSTINASGCAGGGAAAFCSTSLASTDPVSCSYTIEESDNRTTNVWGAVCDVGNCSNVNASSFYMNHVPVVLVTRPNGGETVNQTLGNYNITFNVSDSDSDSLFGSLYYGLTQNSTTNLINSSLNLTNYCSDGDGDTATTNVCSYLWNSTGVYGTYFLTIIINDSYHLANDSSDNSFDARSLVDNTPPNITSQWIETGTIYSGKRVQIYANVSDDNTISSVWVSVNTTPQQNITMRNMSSFTYNATLTAPAVGTYTFKVYSNDTVGNVNNSMPNLEFNVTKPTANPEDFIVPSSASFLHVIKVTSDLNASDILRDVNATLNVPSGFSFLDGYEQTQNTGNYTSNQSRTTTWFVSVPNTEATYTLNVSYYDYYSNYWNSSNADVSVSEGGGGGGGNSYLLLINGYPEVETQNDYYVEAYFVNNGIRENADSTTIHIYDSVGSSIVGPTAMSNPSTGTYNYTYGVGISANEGQWRTVINATKDGLNYTGEQFWKVIGGPFDVRDIEIINSTVGGLNISVVVENTGGANKDIQMVWNLTREDNGVNIDSGGDTFEVSADTETTYYIYPVDGGFTGNARITFLGYWSETERAGAFETFTIVSGEESGGEEGGDGGGSGGSGGGGVPTVGLSPQLEGADLEISSVDEVFLARGFKKIIPIGITNVGDKVLENLVFEIQGLDGQYYSVTPSSILRMNVGGSSTFSVEFLIDEFLEQDVLFTVKSDQVTKTKSVKIIVVPTGEFLLKEIERLRARADELRGKVGGDDLESCEALIDGAEVFLGKEQFINAKTALEEAESCLDDLKEGGFDFSFDFSGNIVWIIGGILVILLIAVLIAILYVLYRKFSVFSFMRSEGVSGESRVSREERKASSDLKYQSFDKKIDEINKKLEGLG